MPTSLNGLRRGPARHALFIKVPSIMEEIGIALVEEQSYNSASVTPWQKPAIEKSAATLMDLGNADVVCYNCGKRGHMTARYYTKVGASAKRLARNLSTQRVVRRTSVRDARIPHRPSMGR